MKKWLLGISLIALLAAPAHAYVRTGSVPQIKNQRTDDGTSTDPTHRSGNGTGTENLPRPSDGPGGGGTVLDDRPTRPVPEPGTMVLASLGLIALGAATRKRRGN